MWYNDPTSIAKKRRGRYLWDMLMVLVKRRTIVFYWIGLSAKSGCAENGHVRALDKQHFETDFTDGIATCRAGKRAMRSFAAGCEQEAKRRRE